MPQPKLSDVQEWEFTEAEELEASKLSTLTVLRLQSMKAFLMKQKAGMPVDPDNFQKYLQAEASMMGKIELLEQLLADHDVATAPAN